MAIMKNTPACYKDMRYAGMTCTCMCLGAACTLVDII